MILNRKILFVSSPTEALPFIKAIKAQGNAEEITTIEDVNKAYDEAVKMDPGIIVFILPVYWQSITKFVQKFRDDPRFAKTELVYIGSLIESVDSKILHDLGVKTLTKGPMPTEEMVRFILKLLE